MSDGLISLIEGDSLGYVIDKIVAGSNVTFDVIGTPGNQQLQISFECCDFTDELVAVAPGEQAGYLENVLIAAAGSDITVTRNGNVLEIGLSGSIEDEKVAASSGETPGYLEDVLMAGDGLEVVNDGNGHIVIQMKAPTESSNIFTRPYAKLVIATSVGITPQAPLNDVIHVFGNYLGGVTGVLVPTTYAGSGSDIQSSFENASSPGMINTTDGTITIKKTGPYRIYLQGNVEVNRGVAAIRAMLLIRRSSSNKIALSSRFGGVIGTNGDNLHVNPASGLLSPLGGWIQRMTVSDSDIVQLQENDVLFFATRVSTNVTDVANPTSVHYENRSNTAINGEFMIYGNDSLDMGFSFGCEYIGNVE